MRHQGADSRRIGECYPVSSGYQSDDRQLYVLAILVACALMRALRDVIAFALTLPSHSRMADDIFVLSVPLERRFKVVNQVVASFFTSGENFIPVCNQTELSIFSASFAP